MTHAALSCLQLPSGAARRTAALYAAHDITLSPGTSCYAISARQINR